LRRRHAAAAHRGLLYVVGLAGAAVGIYFAVHGAESSRPYTFSETLPSAVKALGGDSRVVSIQVDSSGVRYTVIESDGLVHVRDYSLRASASSEGGTDYSREVTANRRRPTAAEKRAARLKLSAFDASVVDSLFAHLDFPQSSSSATFADGHWLLQSGAHPFDKYEARFDGSGLHQTASKSSAFGN
jgi:hypothetical protein